MESGNCGTRLEWDHGTRPDGTVGPHQDWDHSSRIGTGTIPTSGLVPFLSHGCTVVQSLSHGCTVVYSPSVMGVQLCTVLSQHGCTVVYSMGVQLCIVLSQHGCTVVYSLVYDLYDLYL